MLTTLTIVIEEGVSVTFPGDKAFITHPNSIIKVIGRGPNSSIRLTKKCTFVDSSKDDDLTDEDIIFSVSDLTVVGEGGCSIRGMKVKFDNAIFDGKGCFGIDYSRVVDDCVFMSCVCFIESP